MNSATALRIVFAVVCCGLARRTVRATPNGFYCRGSAGNGNLHLKCVTTPCNGTACETVVDYVNEYGPDVSLDSKHKLLVNLDIDAIATIHVLVINYVRCSVRSLYRLIKPVIFKMKLDAPGELHKLRFVNYVNGGPTEEVISKATRVGYFGCDSGKAHPTCGLQYYGLSDPVPYSEGFCCSCLDSVNAARQPRVAYGAHRTVADDPQPDDVGVKLRGDPDCRNLSESPSYANPFTYHESSHCFRYDDLWFNVYKVDASQTVVPLTVELFDRADGVHARQRSRTSTSVRPVSVPGRFTNTVGGGVVVWHTHRSSADGERMVSKGPVLYRYEVNGLHETVGNDLTAMLVLVPQEVPDAYHRSGPPDLDITNPRNYLVIPPDWISKDGMECDKIGVQPRAFYEQPERCYRPRGSCLGGGRQPVQLLREAAATGRGVRRRLLVEDYVRDGAAVRYDRASEQIIVDGRVTTARGPGTVANDDGVSVRGVGEIVLDDNGVIYDKVLLQLSEIHAVSDDQDGDDDETTAWNVRVYVTNLGLTAAEYFVEAADARRRTVQREFRRPSVVHGQQTADVRLSMRCDGRYCNAIVSLYDATDVGADTNGTAGRTPVAHRKFRAVRGSRCYCLWHDRCRCHPVAGSRWPPLAAAATTDDDGGGGGGGGCDITGALTQTEYAAAGFAGDVPPATAAAEMAARHRATVAASLTMLAGYVAAAVTLGLLKAVSPYRSHWLWMIGADWLSDMVAYNEPELRPFCMVRDAAGYYVHPITGSRNIRLLDGVQEFASNALFFVNLPATLCRHYGMWFDQSVWRNYGGDDDDDDCVPRNDQKHSTRPH